MVSPHQQHEFILLICPTKLSGIFFFLDFMYLFLDRGEGREIERERNISVRDIHQSAAFCMPPTGDQALQPRHVPQPGIEPVAFQFTGRHSIH